MDLFTLLGNKKLNEFVYPNPLDSAGRFNVTGNRGPEAQMAYGLLGSRFKFSEAQALKLSNTNVGTLYNCEIQIVRIDTGTITITDLIVGRPVFWVDKSKKLITSVASATTLLAGICPIVITSSNAKGDIIPIIVKGDCQVLLKASSLTKASPLANDPVVANISSSLATADVLADATGWTNVQLALRMGRVLEAWNGAAGTVKKMHLDNAYQVFNNGVE